MNKGFFRTFFSFSKDQQRGIVALSFLLMCGLLFLLFYKPSQGIESNEEIKSQVQAFLAEQEIIDNNRKKKWNDESSSKSKLTLREFDPNTEPLDGFVSMGFSEKLAKNFINYREKVGPYRSKKDVLGLYAIDQELYDQIAQFIQIKPSAKNTSELVKKNTVSDKKNYNGYQILEEKKANTKLSIDINRADTTELKSIKGIGSYYAKSIVKFRDALGGFHSLDQFKEIYAFEKRPEATEILKENTFIDISQMTLINVNTCTKERLISHPYLKAHVAKALYNYRVQNGEFGSLEELKKCHLVTDEIYLKIAPYLSLQ
ncbi:MAG: helix-hairpin-helix domain-containing protein [Flavobacteriales bacterium]|nr:helix-hairpin-helix domain-containing protein [Flavobacteriales bacterium]